jgi:hypothetical protein
MVDDVGYLSSSTPCVLCNHSYNILLYLKQQTESVFSEKNLHFRGYGVSMIQTSRICIKRKLPALEKFQSFAVPLQAGFIPFIRSVSDQARHPLRFLPAVSFTQPPRYRECTQSHKPAGHCAICTKCSPTADIAFL